MTPIGLVVTLLVAAAGAGALLAVERRFSPPEQRILWFAFAGHVVAAIAMVWVTDEVLGGGDLFDYHVHAMHLANALRFDFWELLPEVIRVIFHEKTPLPVPVLGEGHSTGTMICLSAFIFLVLGDSIYSACMIVSIFSFFARVAIYTAFKSAFGALQWKAIAVACLLVPSVTFWSSGMLKESFALCGVAALFWAVQSLVSGRSSVWVWLIGFAGLILTAVIKSYLLIPFGLGLAAWFYLGQSRQRAFLRSVWGGIGSVLLAIGVVVAAGAVFPRYALDNLADQTMLVQQSGQARRGGSNVVLIDPATVGEEGITGPLPFMPIALGTALFRPFLFEVNSAQMFVNALEASVFIGLLLLVLARNGIRRNLATIRDNPVLGLCTVFVLVAALGIGITTTNLGSLSRYRAPIMPFFAVLLVVLSRRRREPLLAQDTRFLAHPARGGLGPRAVR